MSARDKPDAILDPGTIGHHAGVESPLVAMGQGASYRCRVIVFRTEYIRVAECCPWRPRRQEACI
jgi:hypothetical protein